MSKILLNGLSDDLLQMISQYSMEVYFKLRLVSKAVKKVIDEVLPIGQNDDGETGSYHSWRAKFLRRAHWCGFKLLDQRYFDDWIKALRCMCSWEYLGDIVEKFCRDYLPKNGCIARIALDCLCRYNRKDYVRELWEEAKHRFKSISERFPPDCIEDISMLKDFEFFKMVYDTNEATPEHFDTDMYGAVDNSYIFGSWENFRHLVENYPILLILMDLHDTKTISWFKIVKDYWKWLPDVKSQDKDKVMQVIKRNEDLLLFVDESFRKDKDVVMTAVKRNGYTIGFAHESLQKDRDIVMAAVKKYGSQLEFADHSLRKDKDIVLQAVRRDGFALRFADESLRKDPEVVLEAFRKYTHGSALKFADLSLFQDEEFILQALKLDKRFLKYAHNSVKKDKEIVMRVVKLNRQSLQYADESLQNDPDLLLLASRQRKPSRKRKVAKQRKPSRKKENI